VDRLNYFLVFDWLFSYVLFVVVAEALVVAR